MKTLETNEADTNIRFSMVPSKFERIEQWRQAKDVARPKLDKLVADLRLLRDLTFEAGNTQRSLLLISNSLLTAFQPKMKSLCALPC